MPCCVDSALPPKSSLVFCLFFPLVVGAQQAPIALPNTVSLLGRGCVGFDAGRRVQRRQLADGNAYARDGCLATSAYFNTTASGDLRGGVATDPAGNIYVMDSEDAAVRMINARSGIITLVAGLGTACNSRPTAMVTIAPWPIQNLALRPAGSQAIPTATFWSPVTTATWST